MTFLTVFLVPAAYLYFISGRPEDEKHSNRISVLAGVATGIVAILADSLFSPILTLPTQSFQIKLLLVFISDTVLPLLVGVLPLWLLSTASFRRKITVLRPQLFGIAAMYLPYKVLVFHDFPDIWSAVFVSAMYVALLFLADFCIGRLLERTRGVPDMQDCILSALPPVAGMLVINSCKTLWFFCYSAWIFVPVSLLVIASPFVVRLPKYRR
jgi:hypothetical protein